LTELDRVRKDIAKITDRPGKKIDAGIFDVVVALNLNGFETIFSCEGHLDDNRFPRFYPYVDLSYIKPFQELDETKLYELGQKNLKMNSKLVNLLNDFYEIYSDTPHMHRLTCNVSIHNNIELMPLSGKATSLIKDLKERKQIHKIYLEEVNKFSSFLLEAYNKNCDTE